MFTGIIRHLGVIESLESSFSAVRLEVKSNLFEGEFKAGDSVAISGVCLTLVKAPSNSIGEFDLISETLRKTSFVHAKPGTPVNLERSLRLGDSLDGHMVQGHVDGVGRLVRRTDDVLSGWGTNTVRFEFSYPPRIRSLLVEKGSIAVDGVSLTLGEISEENFSVYIIPHTLAETTFRTYDSGSNVNLEADCIAKYLQALARPYTVTLG